jgi:hypothetical protein
MEGNLPENVLEAMLEAMPLEFSIVDKNDKVLAWNKHDSRLFKRPRSVVGNDVRNCHPKQSLDKVEVILEEMKAGKRDSASFWIDMKTGESEKAQKILIQYFALRDPDGNYLGCMEASQNIQMHRELEGQKRLLD